MNLEQITEQRTLLKRKNELLTNWVLFYKRRDTFKRSLKKEKTDEARREKQSMIDKCDLNIRDVVDEYNLINCKLK